MTFSVAECSTGSWTPESIRKASSASPRAAIAGRNLSKADVQLYRSRRRIALKDYGAAVSSAAHVGPPAGRTWCRAYERAEAHRGSRRFWDASARSRSPRVVDSVPLADAARHGSREIFDRLDEVVAGLHSRGRDRRLHHRDVLVARDGRSSRRPAAGTRSDRGPARCRRVFERLSSQDRLAAARMRASPGRPRMKRWRTSIRPPCAVGADAGSRGFGTVRESAVDPRPEDLPLAPAPPPRRPRIERTRV